MSWKKIKNENLLALASDVESAPEILLPSYCILFMCAFNVINNKYRGQTNIFFSNFNINFNIIAFEQIIAFLSLFFTLAILKNIL